MQHVIIKPRRKAKKNHEEEEEEQEEEQDVYVFIHVYCSLHGVHISVEKVSKALNFLKARFRKKGHMCIAHTQRGKKSQGIPVMIIGWAGKESFVVELRVSQTSM